MIYFLQLWDAKNPSYQWETDPYPALVTNEANAR